MKIDLTPALDLIKDFEGLRLDAYQDAAGIWTIGYGTTGSTVVQGLTITQDEAEDLLYARCVALERNVLDCAQVGLNQNQICALISFSYNVGIGALRASTLLKLINARDFENAANEFLKWNHCQGQVLPGLTRRREAERGLFLK